MVGTICVTAFDDSNQNGAQDGIEGPISGVTITLFDGKEIVGTQTTNALAGQLCFEDLQPGPVPGLSDGAPQPGRYHRR